MSILVSGGAGYIGSHTCVELIQAGYDIVVADNLVNSSREAIRRVEQIVGRQVPFVEAELCDPEQVEALFQSHPDIRAVIHFAGLKAVGESVEKPLEYYTNNLVNTLMTNLLARQQELGILQSVGMTGKQVSRMLIAECLWYAGVTVFLSVGIGGILGWIFDYVISSFNIFGELSYQFPLMETVVFVLALLVVTGIFSVVAVRYSKRLSLVERIKTMD